MESACTHALSDNHEEAERCRLEALAHLRGAVRRERQQVEILSAILEGHTTRALGLAFEHTQEFGHDPLMIDMLDRGVAKNKIPCYRQSSPHS
jgi:hypothetical protein